MKKKKKENTTKKHFPGPYFGLTKNCDDKKKISVV